MARRKSKFLSDDDDSSNDSNGGADDPDDRFDPDDLDEAAERELFTNPYQRGKKRARRDNDGDEGELGDNGWGERGSGGARGGGRERGQGRRTDYTKGVAFVSSGGASTSQQPLDNLSTALPIESGEGAEDVEMEIDSDEDSGENDDEEPEEQDDGDEREDAAQEAEEDLAPVPGLAPLPTAEVEEKPLAFAPRGIGARGKGGLGSRGGGGGGIGSRPGMGLGSSSSAPSTTARAMSSFASATSASNIPLGGFGASSNSGTHSPMTDAAPQHAGLGSSSDPNRVGLGARAGIGGGGGMGSHGQRPQQSLVDSLRQRLAAEAISDSDSSPEPEPVAPRERRSFLPSSTSTSNTPVVAPKISAKEQQHFAQLASKGDLGMKLLEKMGWKAGTGLGANQQGIVTPIGEGTKLRKKGAGLATGERSAGAIAEERRRKGLDPEEVEVDEKKGRGRRGGEKKEPTPKVVKDAWQQPKRKESKPKTEYKTYEQIVAESGAEPEGVGMLVDLAGNALPSTSLSSLPAFGAGSADPTRLPELRHNLSLLTSTISSSLSALAREGKGIEERRTYLDHEETRVRKAVEAQEHAVARLEGVLQVVEKIKVIEQEMMGLLLAVEGDTLGPKELLAPFADEFDELLGRYPDEYDQMRLDEVCVGAISPIMRRLFQTWDPLSSPLLAVAELKRWKKHFLIDKDVVQLDGMDVDVFGAASFSNGGSSKKGSDRTMTAYETLMWTLWLPKVRSAINNAWSPSDPTPAVALFTAWSPLLPLFLRDNMIDQLILPKLSKAISDWTPSVTKRGGASLHTIVFPWLEHAGERMEHVMEEAKRKVRSWLKGWKAADGVPKGIDAWKEAFPVADWDALVLKHVLPQLGATLRDRFTVNPRQQDLKPLEDVLAWTPLLRSSMMSQLIETSFFPKWLEALYVWLINEPNFEQVAEWYSYWKSYFDEEIVSLSGVSRGFRKGLDLMNQAMALGDDVKYRLKRPDLSPSIPRSKSSRDPTSTSTATKTKPAPSADDSSISFRTIVEEVAAESNLIFFATGRTNERGYKLFRVSKTVEGKSGVTVYLDGDVVWVQRLGVGGEGEGEWEPVSVAEMVKRATK